MVTWADAADCKRCGSSFAQRGENASTQNTHADVVGAKRDVRKSGMKKVAVGGAYTILYAIVLVVAVMNGYEIVFKPVGLVTGLTPIAWGLAGVLQVTTGVPFEELSGRWDRLAGWQRGVIGISVFGAGLLALGVLCVIAVMVLNAVS